MGPDEISLEQVDGAFPDNVEPLMHLTIEVPCVGRIATVTMMMENPKLNKESVDAVVALFTQIMNELLLQVSEGSVN